MVVVLVVAVAGTPEAEVEVQGPAVVVSTGVAASKQVGSMAADKSHMELAAVEVASALAECACQMVFRTLRARDPGSPRLGTHRTHNNRWVALVHKRRVRKSQGSRISASLVFAITSSRGMIRTGTTTGTGGMFTLTMVASLCLSTGFGAD